MPFNAHKFQLYLDRIKFSGDRNNIKASIETFRTLHELHTNAIPFESLEIHLGRPVKIDEASIFDKLVLNKRGGYCYESNELLAIALEYIGFVVHRCVSRVVFPEVRTRSHKILIVEIKAQSGSEYWLADSGFSGNSLRQPIQISNNNQQIEIEQKCESYKLIAEKDQFNNLLFRLQTNIKKNWVDLYTFNLLETLPIDFEIFNFSLSNKSDSPFVQHIICAKPTDNGRVILVDNKLKIRANQETTEYFIKSSQEYFNVLKEMFGINLSLNEQEILKKKISLPEYDVTPDAGAIINPSFNQLQSKGNNPGEYKQVVRYLTGGQGPALGIYAKVPSMSGSANSISNLPKSEDKTVTSDSTRSYHN